MKKCKNLRFLILSVLLTAVLIVPLIAPTGAAFANSALVNYEGATANGTVIIDENCPVTVEEENLTFDIGDFPYTIYQSEAQFLSYSSKVSAEYHLYNPSDYDVSIKLAFPFGGYPDYYYTTYENGNTVYADTTDYYDITVDGTKADKTLRHTFYTGSFDVDEQVARLRDDYVSEGLFTPQTTVTEYKYKVTTSSSEAVYALTQITNAEDFAYISTFGYRYSNSDYKLVLNSFVRDGDELTVYVIGEQSTAPQFQLYKDYNSFNKGEGEIDGACTMYESNTMTFKQLALSQKPENMVSDMDWYNAVVDNLSYFSSNKKIYYTTYLDVSSWIMAWYLYDISIPAGQRVVNVVNAPVYPSISLNYSPYKYYYEYMLSPAKGWASFANLNVKINTQYQLLGSNPDGFEQTDYGYYIHFDTLPDRELTFTLCATTTPQVVMTERTKTINIFLIVIFGLLIIAFLKFIAMIVTLVVCVSRYNKTVRTTNDNECNSKGSSDSSGGSDK